MLIFLARYLYVMLIINGISITKIRFSYKRGVGCGFPLKFGLLKAQ